MSWLKETVQFDALPFVFDFPPQEPEEEGKDAEPQVTEAEADKYQVLGR